MTYQNIFIQILSDVSGQPKNEISELLVSFKKANPGGNWDKTLSKEDANKLLSDLRKEALGILKWLCDGAAIVAKHETGSIN